MVLSGYDVVERSKWVARHNLEYQLAQQPQRQLEKLRSQLDSERIKHKQLLEAWRKYDGAVSGVLRNEMTRLTRASGFCLGIYLGGVVSLALAAYHWKGQSGIDLSKDLAVWLTLAGMFLAIGHMVWKLAAKGRTKSELDALRPMEPLPPSDPKG